ncbi:MAG: SDR family oxidoreductase, partial [Caldilineaceae bacterium]|nr:SDR family oxidoreductase [Caldilineaceae bacterium]
MSRFAGKVALITGSSSGIGRGIAESLAGEGADIVINHLGDGESARAAAEAVTALGGRALIHEADVSNRDAVIDMVQKTVDHFGSLDIVVANAAFSIREPVLTAQWENVRAVIEVAQFGVFHTCQLAVQQMVKQIEAGRPGGKVLITGSVLAEYPFPNSAAYNMAKAAINHFARTLAAELLLYRINVNVINPGWIDTPGERRYTTDAEIAAAAPSLPWGRLGTPADIGKAAAFLLSDDA